MIRFRPVRGGLIESMWEEILVDRPEDLFKHLCKYYPQLKDQAQLEISPYSDRLDVRNGWRNTHLVSIRGLGPIGFCEL